jgi:hypothetical protein
MTIIESYHNADTGLQADVFTVGTSKQVRFFDADCGETIEIRFFSSFDKAHAYARKVVS